MVAQLHMPVALLQVQHRRLKSNSYPRSIQYRSGVLEVNFHMREYVGYEERVCVVCREESTCSKVVYAVLDDVGI